MSPLWTRTAKPLYRESPALQRLARNGAHMNESLSNWECDLAERAERSFLCVSLKHVEKQSRNASLIRWNATDKSGNLPSQEHFPWTGCGQDKRYQMTGEVISCTASRSFVLKMFWMPNFQSPSQPGPVVTYARTWRIKTAIGLRIESH